MKKIINTVFQILESMGRARAASILVRHGNYDAARRLMIQD